MAGSAYDEPNLVVEDPAAEARTEPPGALARELPPLFKPKQKRQKRTYREHLRLSLIARAPPQRDGRINGAQLLRDVLAINKQLYDGNVAFDQRL